MSDRPMDPDSPFRILVAGDFSGRRNRGLSVASSTPFRTHRLDRDNYGSVLRAFGAELRLPLRPDGGDIVLKFAELDDFRPEAIYERSDLFRALRYTRDRLDDPATFEDAAQEVRAWSGAATGDDEEGPDGAGEGPARTQATEPLTENQAAVAGLLDAMVEQTQQRASSGEDWDAMVRELVAPHVASLIVPGTDPDQPALVRRVDDAIAEQMRAVLHHPDFQELEAAWRALFLLVRRLETTADLQIHVTDVSKPELAADLGVSGRLSTSRAFRAIVDETVGTSGADPWGLVVGNYTFEAVPADVAVLLRMAKLVAAAGAPFLAGVNSRVVGCESLRETPDPDDWTYEGDKVGRQLWRTLRGVPEAACIGLFWPRFLGRQPYGAASDEVEGFEFEEFPDGQLDDHEHLLWMNSAFVGAIALGRAFTRAGWALRRAIEPELDDLPTWVRKDADGDDYLQPCAEGLLSARAVEPIRAQGVIPVLSVQGAGRVLMGHLGSLADPPSEIVGSWE